MKYIIESEIINQIWNNSNKTLKRNNIKYLFISFVKIIGEEIKKDCKVKIEGLGTFSFCVRHAHIGKNINGAIEEIPDTKRIKFKPSKIYNIINKT